MCFYYLVHIFTNKGGKESNGSKNARTFLFGSFAYICLYMAVAHYSLKNKFSSGILKSSLIMLFVVDLCTMGYIYKSYYGRLLTHELFATDDSEKDWKFDEKNHKYDRKSNEDYELENEIEVMKNNLKKNTLNELKKEIQKSDDDENNEGIS